VRVINVLVIYEFYIRAPPRKTAHKRDHLVSPFLTACKIISRVFFSPI